MASADVTGCITDQELADVKAALGNGFTEWTSGKRSFHAEMCGHDSIDMTTEKLFALVGALEIEYTPKSR